MTIESKTLEHEGFTIRIDVEPDFDTTPDWYDCYDEGQIEAWRRGEWIFVGYVYTALKNGVELAEESIWGTEYSDERGMDEWIAEDYYHPDLLSQVAESGREKIKELTA